MTRFLLTFLCLLAAFPAAAAEHARRDAVFILGEDEAGEGNFFAPAAAYYSARIRPDIDLFVAGARSLQGVREWLVRSHRAGDPPWGRVFLVAHGSPWIGLALPLYSDGTHADLPDLERALQHGEFPVLPHTVFDGQTRLVIESCGVGRRGDLLDLYARLFGGAIVDRSVVEASDNWIEFGQSLGGDGHKMSWRHERLFEAQVMPHATLDSAQMEQVRKKLSARLVAGSESVPFVGALTWRTAPVRIELAIAENATCRSDRAIRRLNTHASVAEKLRAYGLRESNLAWRIEHATTGCSLVGQGILAVLGQGSLSGELLP